MKKLISIYVVFTILACHESEPISPQCDEAWDEGYDMAITDTQAEIERLKEELEWTKFQLTDEKTVCETEINRLTDLNNNLYVKIQLLEREQ